MRVAVPVLAFVLAAISIAPVSGSQTRPEDRGEKEDGGMSFQLVHDSSHRGPAARAAHFAFFLMGLAALAVVLGHFRRLRSARAVERVRKAGDQAVAEGSDRGARRRAMERAARAARFELGRGLWILLTLALTAPLVGTLGAVAGLRNLCRGIALLGSVEIGPVSEALAEALASFRFALVIGIPSFWAYAYLRARVDRTARAMEAAAEELG